MSYMSVLQKGDRNSIESYGDINKLKSKKIRSHWMWHHGERIYLLDSHFSRSQIEAGRKKKAQAEAVEFVELDTAG